MQVSVRRLWGGAEVDAGARRRSAASQALPGGDDRGGAALRLRRRQVIHRPVDNSVVNDTVSFGRVDNVGPVCDDVSAALAPLGGGVQATQDAARPASDEPVVAREHQVAQDDDDHPGHEQADHQPRHPRLGQLHLGRDRRRVARRRRARLTCSRSGLANFWPSRRGGCPWPSCDRRLSCASGVPRGAVYGFVPSSPDNPVGQRMDSSATGQACRVPRILVIDSYDSFVYNLVQYLGELGADPIVYRNDALTVDEAVDARSPTACCCRPGPGARRRPASSATRSRPSPSGRAGVRRVPRAPGDRPRVRRRRWCGRRS